VVEEGIAAVAEALRFDLMIVLEGFKLPPRGQLQSSWNLKGVSVPGSGRRLKSGLQLSTESSGNANHNTKKPLEPPWKRRISAIKHFHCPTPEVDYVINLGCVLTSQV
jgi:hypothetical protein